MTERRIRAVTFDADQTLWDFAGVYQRALASTLGLMVDRGDVPDGSLTTADLRAIRDELAEQALGTAHDLADIRRASFVEALRRHDHASPEAAGDVLTEHYMQIRFDSIRLYDDVVESLAQVKRRCPIGLLTNGNTDPERCGLPDVFDAVVMGPDHGVEKPDPRAFALIADRLEVEPNELLHVGDDADDVDGVNAVGGVSILIERDGSRPELDERADHTIATLTELGELLGDYLS